MGQWWQYQKSSPWRGYFPRAWHSCWCREYPKCSHKQKYFDAAFVPDVCSRQATFACSGGSPDEINETLTANKRVGQGEVKMIMESASTLKKLCSFLKMKCRRKEVSSVTHQQVRGNFPLVQRFMFISSHSAVASNLSSCYRTYPNLPNPNLPEEGDFQLLCLALDPMLQVREKYIGFQCLASWTFGSFHLL